MTRDSIWCCVCHNVVVKNSTYYLYFLIMHCITNIQYCHRNKENVGNLIFKKRCCYASMRARACLVRKILCQYARIFYKFSDDKIYRLFIQYLCMYRAYFRNIKSTGKCRIVISLERDRPNLSNRCKRIFFAKIRLSSYSRFRRRYEVFLKMPR